LIILFSIAVFAPLQNLAPLMSIPIKFILGLFFASSTEYSPLPHPNSKIIGLLLLNIFSDQLPLNSKELESNSSLVG